MALRRGEYPAAFDDAAGFVESRLAGYGKAGPGCCLPAALIGAAELTKRGFQTVFQAGAAFWRRSAEDTESAMFGFAYDPDSLVSQVAAIMGRMPEFHAWVAVAPAGVDLSSLPAGTHCHAGWLVDYSAHHLPRMSAEGGMPWEFDPPPHPAVIAMGDPEPGCRHVYQPLIEACEFASTVARMSLCRMARQGCRNLGDLWAVTGGPPTPPKSHPHLIDCAELIATPFEAIQLVRLSREMQTGERHVKGRTAVGVW